MDRRVSSGFYKGSGNNFLDGIWTLDEKEKRIIRINQLSETKVYPPSIVYKRITSLFIVFGFYGTVRKYTVIFFV